MPLSTDALDVVLQAFPEGGMNFDGTTSGELKPPDPSTLAQARQNIAPNKALRAGTATIPFEGYYNCEQPNQ